MTEGEILSLLARRFSAPEYAFLTQVRNGTGYQRKTDRTADALAMSLWPSRGLGLYGFEVKSSRNDWKRELKQPAKAEDIGRFCDRWYVVTADDSMILPGELPEAWGWLACKGAGIVCKVEAPKRQSEQLDLPMVCAILRRVNEGMVPWCDVQSQVDKLVEQRKKNEGYELQTLKNRVAEFEKASGVCVDHWNAEGIGDAVRVVMADRNIDPRSRMRALKEAAERIIKECEVALADVVPSAKKTRKRIHG